MEQSTDRSLQLRKTFGWENEPSFTGHQLAAERESAWQYHNQHIKKQAINWKSALGAQYESIKQRAEVEEKSFWSAGGKLIQPIQE